jgi:hypothetical protein
MFHYLGKQFSCARKPSFRARFTTRSAALSRKAVPVWQEHTPSASARSAKNLPSGSARTAPAAIDAGN